jgi:hypothetical protein
MNVCDLCHGFASCPEKIRGVDDVAVGIQALDEYTGLKMPTHNRNLTTSLGVTEIRICAGLLGVN